MIKLDDFALLYNNRTIHESTIARSFVHMSQSRMVNSTEADVRLEQYHQFETRTILVLTDC